MTHVFSRPDLMELAAAYEPYSVLVTTADLTLPGPQILYANAAFTRMTGYAVHELMGQTPRVLQGPKTDRALLARMKDALLAGDDFIARTVNYKRDGTAFELEWIINHLRDASGRTTHYVALQRDITHIDRAHVNIERVDAELRQAGEQLQATMRRLEETERRLIQRERLAALGQMTVGVVHDLRNAFVPIASFVEKMRALDEMGPEMRAAVDGVTASLAHGRQLLTNLMGFQASGDATALYGEIDLEDLVEAVPMLVKPTLAHLGATGRGHVRIELDLAPVPKVRGNSVELSQVIVNLVSNAIEAMPDGGLVTVRLEPVGGEVRLSVTDTGPGLDPAVQAHCFEPYVTTKEGGSGLGLSVCYGIVRRHGGSIEAGLADPSGATFLIRLPALQAVAVDAPTAGRILLVEDDPAVRRVVAEMLERQGHDVTIAEDGDMGLSLAHEHAYDAVLTDVGMQPTSGIDVAATLQRTRPHLPVVLLSGGRVEEGDLPESLVDHPRLMKPFRPHELAAVIARAVSPSERARTGSTSASS